MIPYYYFHWTGGDVPWLSETPVTGTLNSPATQVVSVTFDASAVQQPGTYSAALSVMSADQVSGTYGSGDDDSVSAAHVGPGARARLWFGLLRYCARAVDGRPGHDHDI